MADYQYQHFPKWMYHPVKNARVVHSQDELEALGDGWQDKPITDDAPGPESAKTPAPADDKPADETPAADEEPPSPDDPEELVATSAEGGGGKKPKKKV